MAVPVSDTSVLVLGASGMLGHALMHELSARPGIEVHGTVRALDGLPDAFVERFADRLVTGVDVLDRHGVSTVLQERRPDVVVNAVGVIKQVPGVADTALTAELNGLLPHLLATWCEHVGCRLVHVSTDCVFSGRRGLYEESDVPDPIDFYGRSKLLGEVVAPPHTTLRTSIIGPELNGKASLFEWFMAQQGTQVKGYRQAVYSGLPTYELASVIADVVIPRPELTGLWHVASEPIDKHHLLQLIVAEYGWVGDLVSDDAVSIDRSMRAERLREATGYAPPPWPELVAGMHLAQDRWHGRADQQ